MSDFMQLGQSAVQSGNFIEAVSCFQAAEKQNPKNAQIKACLGQSLCWLGKKEQGKRYLRQSGELLLKKANKNRDLSLVLGLIEQLHFWADYVGALELSKQAVKIHPDNAHGIHLLALTYARLNQKKSALASSRKALQLAPDNTTLSIQLASIEAANGLRQEAKRRLLKTLNSPRLAPEEQFRAQKELANILDKLGEYDQVFTHLHIAGEIAKHLPEVARQDRHLVPQMLQAHSVEFDHALLGRWSTVEFPQDQATPIFLLGFMRTGTTLTQEVLGVHPDIFVADETDLVPATVNEMNKLCHFQGSQAQQLQILGLAEILHLRAFYWKRARDLYGSAMDKRLFLDKTTMNTIDLGFINTIFPDAKLIFLLRDPRDVCLSCFMQTMIATPSTVHLYTWQDTAHFYALVMNWWLTIKSKLTLDYMEFKYETAVFEFESSFRQVFNFLNLEWNPAVVDFHKQAAGKYIASPSFTQVAQPLYTSSVGRWLHYEADYRPILEILQPFLDAFQYGVENRR